MLNYSEEGKKSIPLWLTVGSFKAYSRNKNKNPMELRVELVYTNNNTQHII